MASNPPLKLNLSKSRPSQQQDRISRTNVCTKCGSENIIGISAMSVNTRACKDCGHQWNLGGLPELVGMRPQEIEEYMRDYRQHFEDSLIPVSLELKLSSSDLDQINEITDLNQHRIHSFMLGE